VISGRPTARPADLRRFVVHVLVLVRRWCAHTQPHCSRDPDDLHGFEPDRQGCPARRLASVCHGHQWTAAPQGVRLRSVDRVGSARRPVGDARIGAAAGSGRSTVT
jgi:hypothetical protein